MIIDKFLHSCNNLQGITLFVHCSNMPIAKAHSINSKGKITWSHGQFCIFICAYLEKNPFNSSFNSLALTCFKRNEMKRTERGCKTVKWFHEFFIGYLCLNSGRFTCRLVNSYGRSNRWNVISFLVLKQIFLVWQVIHNFEIMFISEECLVTTVSLGISLILLSFTRKFSWKIKGNNHLAPPCDRSALFYRMTFFGMVQCWNYFNLKIPNLLSVKAIYFLVQFVWFVISVRITRIRDKMRLKLFIASYTCCHL